MFNTVARVAGITVLGGLTLFGAYNFSRDVAEDNEASPETATEIAESTADIGPIDDGFGGVPEGTETLPFDEGQVGETVEPVEEEDIAAAATSPVTDEMSEEDRLLQLGEGGLLSDTDVEAAAEAAISSVEETVADLDEDIDTGVAEIAALEEEMNAAADEAEAGLRGLPAATDAAVIDAVVDAAMEAETRAPSDADPTETNDPSTTQASSDIGSPAATPAEDATPETTAEVPSKTAMIRNPVQRDKDIASAGFTKNPVQTDKKDSGKFFTTNKKLIDKPDEGPFFTDRSTAKTFDPCTKADGTPYMGPGTVTNPFADTNPCLPTATAEGYSLTPPTPPVVPAQFRRIPLQPGFYGPRFPRPTNGGKSASDYRSI